MKKKIKWLRDKLRGWYRYSDWSPRQIRWSLRNKFITKPNKIHVKYFSDWRWIDKSDLIRHLPFVALVEFIEGENPYEHFDTENSNDAEGWKELKELYQWYKDKKFEFDSFDYMEEKLGYTPKFGFESIPLENGDHEMRFHKKPAQEDIIFHESIRAEQEKEEEFTRKACRVIELYGHLWT